MKCTVHDLEFNGFEPGWVELGVHRLSKSYLNQKYQFSVHLCCASEQQTKIDIKTLYQKTTWHSTQV